MLFSSRRDDDADVIRARLRALLVEPARGGWSLDDDPADPTEDGPRPGDPTHQARARLGTPDWDDEPDPDSWAVEPVGAGPDAVTVPIAASGHPVGAPGAAGRHRVSGPATRVAPAPRSARTLWVAALVAALLVAGWSWLDRPAVQPVDAGVPLTGAQPAASTGAPVSTPAPSDVAGPPGQIVVDVVGLVVTPGLVTLPAGARVADALAAAGGLLPEVDPATLNAAALLGDGQQLAVGVPGAVAAGPVSTGGNAAPSGLVDLNAATVTDLDALPGIGPVLAQRIVDHREQQGPFGSVEQLDDVNGIGPTLYTQIAPLVTV